MNNWKSGIILNVAKTEGGRTRLCFKRNKPEGEETIFFFLVLSSHDTAPYKTDDPFKRGNFIEGDLHNKMDTYYEQIVEEPVPEGHQDLNDGEEPIGEVVDGDIVESLCLSLANRVDVACAAATACRSEGEDFDFWVDKITNSIRNMNKVGK